MINKKDLIKRFKEHQTFDTRQRPTYEHLAYANLSVVNELGKIYNFEVYGIIPGFGLSSPDGHIDIPTSMLEKLASFHNLPWLSKSDVV